ncbi:FAM96B protein [Artomyces pyxidatus]|uniref:FAM96B protein n=1 Tax=Artomyces pyxidatus TaxID=48021 RepID=A0ACB8SSF0_9AGAM|nr:FAM96B protein [Artomyces pyxidatus]
MDYNPNPIIVNPGTTWTRRKTQKERHSLWLSEEGDDSIDADDNEVELIDGDEVFDLIRSISDPEHRSMTLEQLAVVSAPQITVSNQKNHVMVEFTPTVPHCGMSTVIGLSIRVRLLRSLPNRFKVDIKVKPGSHTSEHAVNKQLNDKERVAAALENNAITEVLETCLESAGRRGRPADI